jgi:hypothetical protein
MTTSRLGAPEADLLSDTKPAGTLVSQKLEYLTVAGGAAQTVLDYAGSGYVSSLFLAIAFGDGNSIDAGVINIYYDGEPTPTISTTLPQFFQAVYVRGAAAPNSYFNNKFFGANFNGPTNTFGSFYTTLPIPFAARIKIEITNGSDKSILMWSVATLQTGLPNAWPRTRKLRVATHYVDAPPANSTQTIVNLTGKGRLVGLWMLTDDHVHSLTPLGAEWEGNFRFYIDEVSKTWTASTAFSTGDTIIDGNGNKQTVTAAGTSGEAAPLWNEAAGGTTKDGSVTWKQTPGDPTQVWLASRAFERNMAIMDGNGCVQRVTKAGTSGTTAPSFNATAGGTTMDGTVTWTNEGRNHAAAAYHSSGAEDYFMMGFYGAGVPAMSSSNGTIGTTFCLASPLSHASTIRSFYRFHTGDPITFDTSLAITLQAGDTSQMAWTGGATRLWLNAYYYTE